MRVQERKDSVLNRINELLGGEKGVSPEGRQSMGDGQSCFGPESELSDCCYLQNNEEILLGGYM